MRLESRAGKWNKISNFLNFEVFNYRLSNNHILHSVGKQSEDVKNWRGRQRQTVTGCLEILFNFSSPSCINLHTVELLHNLYLRCDYKACLCWTINCLYFQIHGLGFWESLIIIFIDWDWEAREEKLYFSKFHTAEKWSEVNDTCERNLLSVYHYSTAATGRERQNEAQSARYFLNVQFSGSFQQAGKQAGKDRECFVFLGSQTSLVALRECLDRYIDNDRDGRGREERPQVVVVVRWVPARMIVHTLTLCIVPDKSIMTVRKYPHTLSPLKSYLEILHIWTRVKTVLRICVKPAWLIIHIPPTQLQFLGDSQLLPALKPSCN